MNKIQLKLKRLTADIARTEQALKDMLAKNYSTVQKALDNSSHGSELSRKEKRAAMTALANILGLKTHAKKFRS